MRKYVHTINFQNYTIQLLPSPTYHTKQSHTTADPKKLGSKTAGTTHIKPGDTKIINIYPNRDTIAKELIFTGNDLTEQLGFEIKNQLVPGHLGTIPITMKNTSNSPIKLQRNRNFGNLRLITETSTRIIVIPNKYIKMNLNIQPHLGYNDVMKLPSKTLHMRRNVFAKGTGKTVDCDSIMHKIKVTPDAPVRMRYYIMDRDKEEILQRTIHEVLSFSTIEKPKKRFMGSC